MLKTTLSNLLIVEDNSIIGNDIAKAAKEINSIKEIYLKSTIQEAISTLEETDFKLIVLDLNLLDGNGIEVLKYLKEKQTETKVLVFSSSIELKNSCLRYGAFDFFDKAKDFDKLIETLGDLNEKEQLLEKNI